MTTKNKNLKSLDQFIDENIGKKGTKKREQFDREYEVFKIGVLIQQAREEKGLTQEQLAQLAGTNKSYISNGSVPHFILYNKKKQIMNLLK